MSGFIVNLLGPPAAGKTTFATRFVLEHPYFTYTSIDAWRAEYGVDSTKVEDKAWTALLKDCREHKNLILESSGLSYRLPAIFKDSKIQKRRIYSIAFIGDSKIFHTRLKGRIQKRPVPFGCDEHSSIDWVLQHINKCSYPIDLYVTTDGSQFSSDEEMYRYLCNNIAKARLGESK